MAPSFFPIVRVTNGASAEPMIAERNTLMATQPICCGVKPKK